MSFFFLKTLVNPKSKKKVVNLSYRRQLSFSSLDTDRFQSTRTFQNALPHLFQEDLEEFEVKEGLAMAEAEEAQGSGPGSTVSSLVKSAVDGSLTQTFSGEDTRA